LNPLGITKGFRSGRIHEHPPFQASPVAHWVCLYNRPSQAPGGRLRAGLLPQLWVPSAIRNSRGTHPNISSFHFEIVNHQS
jgi:hypothetical protein